MKKKSNLGIDKFAEDSLINFEYAAESYSYKVEYARLRDPIATLHYCHNNVAKAGFYTTVTVVVGFSIMMLSNFIPTILFGLLTALAMSVALLAALTLMPQLILWWQPFHLEND